MKKFRGLLCAAIVAASAFPALAGDNCRKVVYTTQRQVMSAPKGEGCCRFPLSYAESLKRAEDATKAEAEVKRLAALVAKVEKQLASEKAARNEAQDIAAKNAVEAKQQAERAAKSIAEAKKSRDIAAKNAAEAKKQAVLAAASKAESEKQRAIAEQQRKPAEHFQESGE